MLLRELRLLGFERSYQTLTRELRRLGCARPARFASAAATSSRSSFSMSRARSCSSTGSSCAETPWGEPAYVLVGALSHSGRIRAVIGEGMDFARLVGALDGVLRRLGGTTRCWRTDRMATIVEPGSGRLRAEAAELAKHYGVTVSVCPRYRPQRKGVVEAAIRYLRPLLVAHRRRRRCRRRRRRSLDRWCSRSPTGAAAALTVAEKRRRSRCCRYRRRRTGRAVRRAGRRRERPGRVRGQPLQRPAGPGRPDGDGPRPGRRAGRCSSSPPPVSWSRPIAELPAGAGQLVRLPVHQAALERAVLAAFTTQPRCARKPNRPPSAEALAARRR